MYYRFDDCIDNGLDLQGNLEKYYGFHISNIRPADRGSYGETWLVNTLEGNFFVKVHFLKSILEDYRNSLIILDYLQRQAIEFIHTVILTIDGKLWCKYKCGVMAVFSYISGQHCNRGVVPCKEICKLLSGLYKIPVEGRLMETFSNTFDKSFETLQKVRNIPSLIKYVPTIEKYFNMLDEVAKICFNGSLKKVITHGDIGNNMIFHDDRFFVVDWDTAKIAHPERDLWYVVRSCEELELAKNELEKNGVGVSISINRMIYYALQSYFTHLWNHIVAIEGTTDEREKRRLVNYIRRYFFNGFFNDQIVFFTNINSQSD